MNDRSGEKQERWLAGDHTGTAAREFEQEVLHDPVLADEAYAALALEEVLHEVATRPSRIRSPRRLAWAGGLMAAALAFMLILPRAYGPGDELPLRLRSAGDTGAAVGFAPVGEFDHFPIQFQWHTTEANPQSRFRWELYDAQARRRSVVIVADSILVRNASDTPVDSVGVWLWLVVELKPDGQEGPTSAAVEFTVREKDHQ